MLPSIAIGIIFLINFWFSVLSFKLTENEIDVEFEF